VKVLASYKSTTEGKKILAELRRQLGLLKQSDRIRKRYYDQSNPGLTDPPKQKRVKGSKLRSILLPKPDEEDGPWLDAPAREGGKIKLWDLPIPFNTDGFITREGYFLHCDPYGHDAWTRAILGTPSSYPEKIGWVTVWSYTSMFKKGGDTDLPYFRWDGEKRLTDAQQLTILKWCEARKVSLKRALCYHFDDFHKKPTPHPGGSL